MRNAWAKHFHRTFSRSSARYYHCYKVLCMTYFVEGVKKSFCIQYNLQKFPSDGYMKDP